MMDKGKHCPFCRPDGLAVWFEDEAGFVFRDAFPVSEGHTLVIPRRHSPSVFDLPAATQMALWRLVAEARIRLQETFRADAFSIGVNDGLEAGQTVMHAHIHVIPRRQGERSTRWYPLGHS